LSALFEFLLLALLELLAFFAFLALDALFALLALLALFVPPTLLAFLQFDPLESE
jgi:hypothetical protein